MFFNKTFINSNFSKCKIKITFFVRFAKPSEEDGRAASIPVEKNKVTLPYLNISLCDPVSTRNNINSSLLYLYASSQPGTLYNL